jgi:hypothetical protein
MGADVHQLKDFQRKLATLSKEMKDEYFEQCAKELAARLLAKVIKRTPVGVYPASSGKVGGTLRRGWTANQDTSAADYASRLQVTKTGKTYTIEIVNPVEYASYVEYGHRTPKHDGWVEGQFFLTISEQEIQRIAPKVLAAKLDKMMEEALKK